MAATDTMQLMWMNAGSECSVSVYSWFAATVTELWCAVRCVTSVQHGFDDMGALKCATVSQPAVPILASGLFSHQTLLFLSFIPFIPFIRE